MDVHLNKDATILKYFVLSLFDIAYETIKEEYVTAYVNKEGTNLFIELKANGIPDCILNNTYYSGIFKQDNKIYVVLKISDTFEKDLKCMVKGKYSQISTTAKSKIVQLSGLDYKRYDPTKKVKFTSPIIAGLFKNPTYKKGLEQKLGVILSDESELIDRLSKNAFIETIIK